ncbi:sunset domain-containing protein [Desertihabitans aurantiacus]|uniref:sunset domain-containing protein n=1 Tax=Desertihabitans aurantiacus TaxID=2282477 RepID=UPI0013008D24|nr:hypothetical protein [Desertihabitans aurantiacus]
MSRKNKVLRAAAETSHTAAERGADVAEKAQKAVADYVEQLAPYVEMAGEKVGPLAHQAKVASAVAAHQAVETLGPKLNDALEKVSPAVETAREKMQDDLLPRLSELLERAAETELAQTATSRGAATVAALKGELELPKKKKSKGRWFRRLAVIAAVGGVAFVLFKKFFGPKDSGWETYQPSAPYAGSTTTTASPSSSATTASDAPTSPAGTAQEAVAEASTEPTEPDTVAEKVDRVDPDQGASATKYGANAYIGSEPPEGFTIKGNERSMKYHTPGTGGYDRTIADVWFTDETAAEAAGFTKAQR